MKIKFFLLITILSFICPTVVFGQVKSFSKEDTAVVPSNQSQDQVIAYLTQKLTREATEEAGVFIKSELHMQEGNVTKEEITNIAGSISKIKKEKVKTYTENGQQYVYMKLKVSVDTDSVKTFLTKIKQDNAYKEEVEKLRKENLQLEQKLRTASKQQFDQELSLEAKHQVEIQKQRAIEYNKLALQAKEEFSNAERKQQEEELKRQQQMVALQHKLEEEDLARRSKIAQEKDAIKRAELENQAQIKELEQQAQLNALNLRPTDSISIQRALQDTQKIREEIANTVSKFDGLLQSTNAKLKRSYIQQREVLEKGDFLQEKPVKDAWETTENYNRRVQQYEREKESFDNLRQTRLSTLESDEQASIKENEKNTQKSLQKAVRPLVAQLNQLQTSYFPDANSPRAKLISIDKIDADEQYFIMDIEYNGKVYSPVFYFSDIGLEKAKLLYQTRHQFIIEPLFSVANLNDKPEAVLSAFRLTHAGTKLRKVVYLYLWLDEFPEIEKYLTPVSTTLNKSASPTLKAVPVSKKEKNEKKRTFKDGIWWDED